MRPLRRLRALLRATLASGATLLALACLGACGSPYGELETLRAGACQGAEAALEAEMDCGPERSRPCTEADYARMDCLRAGCDAISAELHRRAEED